MSETALYCRTAYNSAEAERSQVELLKWYAQKNGFNSCAIYCEWNTSGVTLDRPFMQKLLSDVRTGEVKRIIVKDLSRFARSFLIINELFRLLREYDVEVISINDGGVIDIEWGNDLADAIRLFTQKEKTWRSKITVV